MSGWASSHHIITKTATTLAAAVPIHHQRSR